MKLIIIIGIIIALLLYYSPESPEAVIITPRYVSSSSGDDKNDGASPERAWKTLTKVSEQVFGPGAIIYLKRGDRWNEALIPKGKGDAKSDKWVTVKPYGSDKKEKPVIDRKSATDLNKDWAIKLVDLEGWQLEDIIIKNSRTGIVYMGTSETDNKSGLKIVRVEFYNIRGLPNHTKTIEEDKRYYRWMRGSSAISITGRGYCNDGVAITDENCSGDKNFFMGSYGPGLDDVLIEDVSIENATYGIWIWGGGFIGGKGENYKVVNPIIKKAGIGGIEISFVEDSSIINPKIEYAGGDNCWSGTFGIDVNYTEKLLIKGGEVAYTLGKIFYEGDGTGINLNGPNKNLKIEGVNIHDNDAMAIAIQGAEKNDPATYEFSDNRIWNNARKTDNPAPGQYEYPEFILAWNHQLRSSFSVKNNLIKMKPNRELIMVVNDEITPNIWKNELSLDEARLPGSSFCGNRDTAKSNSPLIAGNQDCK